MSVSLLAGIEIVRPWLTTGGVMAGLALLLNAYVQKRRAELALKKAAQDYQLRATADGRTNLQFIIDNLRRDIELQRDATEAQRQAAERQSEAHEACQTELAAVRERLRGLTQQFLNFQLNVAEAMPLGRRSPLLEDMRRQFDDLAAQEASVKPQS